MWPWLRHFPSLGFGLVAGIPFPLKLLELESLSARKTRLAASSSPSVSGDWVCTLNISKHLGGMKEYYDLVDRSFWTGASAFPCQLRERKGKNKKHPQKQKSNTKPKYAWLKKKKTFCWWQHWLPYNRGKINRNLGLAEMAGLGLMKKERRLGVRDAGTGRKADSGSASLICNINQRMNCPQQPPGN